MIAAWNLWHEHVSYGSLEKASYTTKQIETLTQLMVALGMKGNKKACPFYAMNNVNKPLDAPDHQSDTKPSNPSNIIRPLQKPLIVLYILYSIGGIDTSTTTAPTTVNDVFPKVITLCQDRYILRGHFQDKFVRVKELAHQTNGIQNRTSVYLNQLSLRWVL